MENWTHKDIIEKATVSKVEFVPFTHGPIHKSRGKAGLQNNLKADNKWHASEKGMVPSVESGGRFRGRWNLGSA